MQWEFCNELCYFYFAKKHSEICFIKISKILFIIYKIIFVQICDNNLQGKHVYQENEYKNWQTLMLFLFSKICHN